MSNYGRPGQTGGGGVRPAPGTGSPGGGHRPSGRPHYDRDRSQPDDVVSRTWPGYLDGGYFDSDGNLLVQYVSRCLPGDEHLPDAQQRGVDRLIRSMAAASPTLTNTQLRRYFQYCRRLEIRLRSGASTWLQLRHEFVSLDSKASEAYGKQPPKIPGLFLDFIRRNVAATKSREDFLQGFIPHFEALVGFASGRLEKERN